MVITLNLKKVKIINCLFLFVLSFLWHFIYDWFPSNLTAIFFPVNESIWEHMKIIYGVFIFGGFFQILLCHKFKIDINNIYIEMVSKAILGIIFYLAIFIPVYLLIGENFIFSISLLFITYCIMEIMGYYILKGKELNIIILPVILIILGYILFGLLTFYPRHNFLFFDSIKYGYGILK